MPGRAREEGKSDARLMYLLLREHITCKFPDEANNCTHPFSIAEECEEEDQSPVDVPAESIRVCF